MCDGGAKYDNDCLAGHACATGCEPLTGRQLAQDTTEHHPSLFVTDASPGRDLEQDDYASKHSRRQLAAAV